MVTFYFAKASVLAVLRFDFAEMRELDINKVMYGPLFLLYPKLSDAALVPT
jgi:hypothetical protein